MNVPTSTVGTLHTMIICDLGSLTLSTGISNVWFVLWQMYQEQGNNCEQAGLQVSTEKLMVFAA